MHHGRIVNTFRSSSNRTDYNASWVACRVLGLRSEGDAWFFGCWLDLLIEQAWWSVLAIVDLIVLSGSWSSCREVCSVRERGDAALGDVLVVRRAVACVAGWTGSANEPIAVRTRTYLHCRCRERAREISNALMMVTGSEQSGLLMMIPGMA